MLLGNAQKSTNKFENTQVNLEWPGRTEKHTCITQSTVNYPGVVVQFYLKALQTA